MGDKKCVIRNVPHVIGDDDEECIDLGVSIKVTTLRDLMWEEEIPIEIDFKEIEDIEY